MITERDIQPVTQRNILEEAADIVAGARQKAYGPPERNFGRIAALWTDYLTGTGWNGPTINGTDVALMMILMKVARLQETPTHRDSLVDLAGYAACIEDMWTTKP